MGLNFIRAALLTTDVQGAVFLTLWLILQALLFALGLVNYHYTALYSQARALLGWSLVVARASALVLHVDIAFILFPVCRTFISILRSTPLGRVVPFDRSVVFHKLCAYSILVFSLVHTFAHYANYAKLVRANPDGPSFAYYCFVSGPGLTGHIMLLALLLMTLTSLNWVKKSHFETFWYTHHLFLVFFGGFTIHGGFCLVKPDTGTCGNMASFWKYWVASGVLYLTERILRDVRARRKTVIAKVVQHPSNTVEVQINKDFWRAKAGQYIFLNCPEISLHQWHPFTLTSAPEEKFLSVHVRVAGDWTRQFAERLGCKVVDRRAPATGAQEKARGIGSLEPRVPMTPTTPNASGHLFPPGQLAPRPLPQVLVDGPFGCASEDVFNYEVAVLIGAGIGVTPFASVLKSIWYRTNAPLGKSRLRKVYFMWIARDKESFEWFQSLLKAIENEDVNQFIEIRTYLTGRLNQDEMRNVMLNDEEGQEDALTGLKSPTYYGRPNWDQTFSQLSRAHPSTDIGVFFCGPKRLNNLLSTQCKKQNLAATDGAHFFYNKENF
ncbi:hypothetical protein IWQ60_003093 [Tieghemiomyces parasiticus]|uniref:FAD-binding FR-type domain-containing protein n=1 Tax=Tieghemiomyces parasiticus TaxID=78921 RepID=A0A9W8DWS7_9FUNG|nr:hypothetical protein IWQ60_003093 [Tieghemiomyces parasiticus]